MTAFTHSLALLIGIDTYANGIPRLTTAVNDAARLAELLRDAHGYETVLLTEPATGRPVTRARLATLFTEELPARLGEDDRLLVYFAGHGVALDGDDGPRGYLAPQDARPGDSATMLAMTDLHAWLTALPCRHMLAILDCCFAGAFRWASTRHIGALPDVIYRERYDRYQLSPAWQVLTSAAYDQKALDVLAGDAKRGALTVDGRLHSPFALALFDALANGEADLVPKGQGDGVITATELYLYLRERVEMQAEKQAGHEQTPGLWPLNKHRKGEFIFLVPGHPLNLPPAPDLTAELNPYRGLKSYDQKDSPLFFGREEEIRELVQRVGAQPFLAVLGASGTGKSSLVKAGVLPRLGPDPPAPFPASRGASGSVREGGDTSPSPGRGGAEGEVVYRVLPPMRPTDHPVQALAALLRAGLGEDPSGLGDPKGLAQIIARWAAAHPGQRLVLTIDQFEELATLCRDDAERERFLRLLAAAVEQQPAAFRLIITLRTDFEPQFTQAGSPLAAAWQAGRYVVPPMDIEDLRQVIEGPAAVRVLYFDPPELVDDLVKEVIQTPGALPLLSFTLSELYVKYVQSGRDDRALSGADYRALGGVVGSLRNRASEEYDHLPDDAHRTTMQRVMLRMVAVEGGELARRRVALSELLYPTAEENERVKTVLDRLVEARLLVRGTADPSPPPRSAQGDGGGQGQAYVEPAHDALVLAWDKLLRWKKEAEEYLPLQRRLAQAASEWNKAKPGAKSGLLWDDDPRLPQVEETLWPTDGKQKGLRGRVGWVRQVLAPKTDAPTDTKWLNGAELAFTQASVSRRASTLRRIVSITAAVMVALAGLAGFATYQARQANMNAARSQGRFLANAAQNQTDIELRLLLGVEAIHATDAANIPPTQEALVELTRALDQAPLFARQVGTGLTDGATQDLNGIEWRGDGRQLAINKGTYGNSAQAVMLDLEARQMITLSTAGENVSAYHFDPQGKYVAVVSDAGVAVLKEPSRSLQCPPLKPDAGALHTAFSPSGSLLFISPAPNNVYMRGVSPDNQEIVALDPQTCRENLSLPVRGQLTGFFINNDETRVAIASKAQDVDRTVAYVALWAIADNRAPVQLLEKQATLGDVDGQMERLALIQEDERSGESRAVEVYDTASASVVFRRSGLAGIGHADMSADGKHLALSFPRERQVRLWNIERDADTEVIGGRSTGIVGSFIETPHRQLLKVVDHDGEWLSLSLFDAETGKLLPSPGQIKARSINSRTDARGTTLAFVLDDGTLVLWNIQEGHEITRLSQKVGSFEAAAFSPDGNRLATLTSDAAGRDGVLRVWDVGETPAKAYYAAGLSSPLFAVGRSIVVLVKPGDDGHWGLWDPAARQVVFEFGDNNVMPLARSANGHWLATWHCAEPGDCLFGSSGQIKLWRLNEGVPHEVRRVVNFSGCTGCGPNSISPDGRWIAIFDSPGLVVVDTQSGEVLTLPEELGAVDAAFSPTELLLAILDGLGRVHLQTLSDDAGKELLALLPADADRYADPNWHRVAFSPDGSKVAATSGMGSLSVWDVRKRSLLKAYVPAADGGSDQRLLGSRGLAFSPDSTQIAVAADSGPTTRIQLLDAATLAVVGEMAESFQTEKDAITDIAFALADGRLQLAAVAHNGLVRIWNVGEKTLDLEIALPGTSEWAESPRLTFNGDGTRLAAVTPNGAIKVSPVDAKGLVRAACQAISRDLTLEERQQFHIPTDNVCTCGGCVSRDASVFTDVPE